jgi:hypothetical protein
MKSRNFWQSFTGEAMTERTAYKRNVMAERAEAVAAERERCARIVEGIHHSAWTSPNDWTAMKRREAIANQIRATKP